MYTYALQYFPAIKSLFPNFTVSQTLRGCEAELTSSWCIPSRSISERRRVSERNASRKHLHNRYVTKFLHESFVRSALLREYSVSINYISCWRNYVVKSILLIMNKLKLGLYLNIYLYTNYIYVYTYFIYIYWPRIL